MVPWVRGVIAGKDEPFSLERLGGHAVLMLFIGQRDLPTSAPALALIDRHRHLFGERARIVGVTRDPAPDFAWKLRGMGGEFWYHDSDARIARQFGAVSGDSGAGPYRPFWLLLDAGLRVLDQAPIADSERIFVALQAYLDSPAADTPAPVLLIPRIFDRDLCRRMIALYEAEGGEESGFFHGAGSVSQRSIDRRIKRRSDHYIEDKTLRQEIASRLRAAVFPMIQRAFQFRVTRVERYNIVCYDSESGGFFKPHRDDTTAASVHRRFACTINLNAEDYEGGELRFPEFDSKTYRAPTGGAAIFSCSLMHEALPVTRGKRYAFLPFFFDEAGHRQYMENFTEMNRLQALAERPDEGEGVV